MGMLFNNDRLRCIHCKNDTFYLKQVFFVDIYNKDYDATFKEEVFCNTCNKKVCIDDKLKEEIDKKKGK